MIENKEFIEAQIATVKKLLAEAIEIGDVIGEYSYTSRLQQLENDDTFQRAHEIGYKDGIHRELEQNTSEQLAVARDRIIKEAINLGTMSKEEFLSKLDGSFEEKIVAAYVIGYENGFKGNIQ